MKIRETCFNAFKEWTKPTPEEIRELISLTGLTGSQVAELVGVSSGRTVRRWVGGEREIPYSAWAILAEVAGYGPIWRAAKHFETIAKTARDLGRSL